MSTRAPNRQQIIKFPQLLVCLSRRNQFIAI